MVVHRLTIRRLSRAAYHCSTMDPPRSQGNRRNESSRTAEVGQEADKREAMAPSISSSSPRTSPEAPPRLSTAMAAVPWAASVDAIRPRETGSRGSSIIPTHGRGTRSAERGEEPRTRALGAVPPRDKEGAHGTPGSSGPHTRGDRLMGPCGRGSPGSGVVLGLGTAHTGTTQRAPRGAGRNESPGVPSGQCGAVGHLPRSCET